MAVLSKWLDIESEGENDVVDLTGDVQRVLTEAGMTGGLVTVYVPGSTGAITTLEYEPGLVKDFCRALGRIAPENERYEHQEAWHDDNGRSHVKAALVGPSLTVPFVGSKLVLGDWQQIVFAEFDVRPRRRRIVVQVVGD